MSKSMSGITMDPTLKEFMSDMNIRKIHKYAGLKLSDDQKFVVLDTEMLGEKADTSTKDQDKQYFDQLKTMLKENEPRYIVYDFGFTMDDGRAKKKLGFLYWCHNDCAVKKRMLYASTKDTVKQYLGVECEFQVNDYDDLDYNEMTKVIEKNK